MLVTFVHAVKVCARRHDWIGQSSDEGRAEQGKGRGRCRAGAGQAADHNSPVVEEGEPEGGAEGVGQSAGDVLVEHHKEQDAAFPVVPIYPPFCRIHKPANNQSRLADTKLNISAK